MHPAARATPGNVTFDTFRKMIASDEDRWIHRATKVSSRYDDRERWRKKNGEERRDLSWDDEGATTLIASSRSTDQTDRELKRSLALLRLALWPRRNTATLGWPMWLDSFARISMKMRSSDLLRFAEFFDNYRVSSKRGHIVLVCSYPCRYFTSDTEILLLKQPCTRGYPKLN